MSDIANIGATLKYCQTKHSNTGHCAGVAAYNVVLISRKNDTNGEKRNELRCEEHKGAGTNKKKVIECTPHEQQELVKKINAFLKSIVGKNIHATAHTAPQLRVKYVKELHCAVMCFQEHSNQWKYVYYHQIDQILNS